MTNEASASRSAQPFRFQRPEFSGEGKRVVKICRTDHMIGIIQVLKRGGETNLHSHAHMDGLWMVLSGRVRFYGEENRLIGDFGPLEGVLVPRGCPYWFENVEEEIAELLQVEAFDRPQAEDIMIRKDRTDYEPRRRAPNPLLAIDEKPAQ